MSSYNLIGDIIGRVPASTGGGGGTDTTTTTVTTLTDEIVRDYIIASDTAALYFIRPYPGQDVATPVLPAPSLIGTHGDPYRTVSTTSVEPSSEFYSLFGTYHDYEHDVTRDNYLGLSRTASGNSTYYLAYGIDENCNAWMATGDVTYLDRAIEYVEKLISVAQPTSTNSGATYTDDFPEWPTVQLGLAFESRTVNAYEQGEAQFSRSTLRMCWLMSIVPSVSGNTAYMARQQAIVEFVGANIMSKWYSRGTIFRQTIDVDFYARYANLAMYIDLLTTNAAHRTIALEIWDKTNGPTGYTTAAGVFRSVRNQLQPHPDDANAYWWSDKWGELDNTGLGEDVSHANLLLAMACDAIWVGYGGWGESDLAALRATYDIIHQPSYKVNTYINGGNPINIQMSSWLRLGMKFGASDTGGAGTQIKMQGTVPNVNNFRAAHYSQLMLNSATHEYVAGSGQSFDETVSALFAARNVTP